MAKVRWGLWLASLAALVALSLAGPTAASAGDIEVVAELELPPLAQAVATSRVLRAEVRDRRLNLEARTSDAYLDDLAAAQAGVAARIRDAIPEARVRWRYRIVFSGLAVVLPAHTVDRLATVPGIARVHHGVRYAPSESQGVLAIKAPPLWGAELSTAGVGVKIGIVDTGLDHTHPFFDAQGYPPLPGFPKGQRTFTTGKVIAARAFPPPRASWRFASRPFDPEGSSHGTHVAGIAAGNYNTRAAGAGSLSGVAPRAYIGNYKVLTIPTGGVGPNGNSPEIVAGIEAAVADGMDVINLSLGEPEVEPGRDIVVRALDAAADAGVVPAVAAGNDLDELGRGSVRSPGSAAKAITAGAIEFRDGRALVTSFSASGPTPMSLLLKPDVAAPGYDILSSLPGRRFSSLSGTSMAAPHVAGAAALLRQRHPTWTVQQIKSALTTTGVPVRVIPSAPAEADVLRQGGGMIDLTRADQPYVFADPSNLSMGLLRTGATAQHTIALADAGGGAGTWNVSVEAQTRNPGLALEVPPTAAVPGALTVTARLAASAVQQDEGGFIVLTRDRSRIRIPYWLRVTQPRLATARTLALRSQGSYGGSTRGRPALVSRYRYPDDPSGVGVSTTLSGPEQVFRFRLRRPVANLGVAILSRARGVQVEPRVLLAGDENRLTGDAGLPLNINPYLSRYWRPEPVAGAILPAAGAYDVVFDSRTAAGAGRFTFRFWVNDTTAPRLRLLRRTVPRQTVLRVSVVDRGAGVDPRSIAARIDGRPATAAYIRRTGRVLVPVAGVSPGRHRLSLRVSDHQEAKNTENVSRVLPNTTTLRAGFVVR